MRKRRRRRRRKLTRTMRKRRAGRGGGVVGQGVASVALHLAELLLLLLPRMICP
jgi:hypothetical protein